MCFITSDLSLPLVEMGWEGEGALVAGGYRAGLPRSGRKTS